MCYSNDIHGDLASSAGHEFESHFEHFFYKKLFSRASYYKQVSLNPQDLDRSFGRHVRPYTETRQPIRLKDPAVPRGGKCYKAYPGLGNRSIFYLGSSVGKTITFDIVEDTSSNPASNTSFKKNACACVLL